MKLIWFEYLNSLADWHCTATGLHYSFCLFGRQLQLFCESALIVYSYHSTLFKSALKKSSSFFPKTPVAQLADFIVSKIVWCVPLPLYDFVPNGNLLCFTSWKVCGSHSNEMVGFIYEPRLLSASVSTFTKDHKIGKRYFGHRSSSVIRQEFWL